MWSIFPRQNENDESQKVPQLVILVCGATGRQGGSVVRQLLQHPEFKVRALVRNGQSGKARHLAELGVELVQGDFDDRTSLVKACSGCYGVFSVQNADKLGPPDLELAQGINVVDAAAEAKVDYFIYSSFESPSTLTHKRISDLYQFDNKAKVEAYLRSRSSLHSTAVRPSFFYDNFISPYSPVTDENGEVTFRLAMEDAHLYMISVDDLAAIVAKLFLRGPKSSGEQLCVAGDRLTMQEVAKVFSKVTGKRAVYESIPADLYRQHALGFEVASMFEFLQEELIERDISATRKIYRGVRSWEKWLRDTDFKGTGTVKVVPVGPRPTPTVNFPTPAVKPPVRKGRTLVLVLGATGLQGSAVAMALASKPTFKVRGFTRTPECEAAKHLAHAGVEIFTGDLDRISSLKAACQGAHSMFFVQPFSADYATEVTQGVRIADVAKECGIQHIVYSGADDVSGKSQGAITECSFFDAKWSIEKYLKTLGLLVTVVRPAFYYENFCSWAEPTPQEDGALGFALPIAEHSKIPMFSVKDLGLIVASILDPSSPLAGRTIDAVAESISMAEIAHVVAEVSGLKVLYEAIPRESYQESSIAGRDEIAAMFKWFQDFPDERDPQSLGPLRPLLIRWRDWLIKPDNPLMEQIRLGFTVSTRVPHGGQPYLSTEDAKLEQARLNANSNFTQQPPPKPSENRFQQNRRPPSRPISPILSQQRYTTLSEPYPAPVLQGPLILVFGITGRQGGSVARTLLGSGSFSVRGVTRSPTRTKAMEFRALGAEVVYGDLNDLDSLRRAMQGVKGVFVVQNYWEHLDPVIEFEQGRNVADACKEANVLHLIYPSGEDVKAASRGRITGASHLDARAHVEKYIRSLHIPTTFIRLPFFMESFYTVLAPNLADDNVLVFDLPVRDAMIPLMSADDMGPIVMEIFKNPQTTIGRTIHLAGDYLSMTSLVKAFSKVSKRPARYRPVKTKDFSFLKQKGSSERAAEYEFLRKHPARHEQALCRQMYPELKTWLKWLEVTGFTGPM